MTIFIPTKPQLWPNRLNQLYIDILSAYQRDQIGVSVDRMMKWYGATSSQDFKHLLNILSELGMIRKDQYEGYEPVDKERSFKDEALDHLLKTPSTIVFSPRALIGRQAFQLPEDL